MPPDWICEDPWHFHDPDKGEGPFSEEATFWQCPECGQVYPAPSDPPDAWCPGDSAKLESATFIPKPHYDKARADADRFDDEAERLGIVKEEYRIERDKALAALGELVGEVEGRLSDSAGGVSFTQDGKDNAGILADATRKARAALEGDRDG